MAKHNEIELLEASLQACLRNALAARQRLSAARGRRGLRDPLAFLTRDEVNELRAEHKQVVAALIKGPSEETRRMGKLLMAAKRSGGMTPQARAIVDFYKTEDKADEALAQQREATAAQIVRAGRRRRGEEL